jgi:asparagine synthase (glutamine-hydrolysing)
MCGIVGIVSPSPAPDSVFNAMMETLAPRGPDGAGAFRGHTVVLGNRRLSVIDPVGSAQPMVAADGSAVLTYNGELYNYRELRAELVQRGHRFRTRGDTEVLLEAYRAWGPAMLDRLEGMFAFAVWDVAAQRLFAARDRLGIKPFYYAWDGQTFVFASEIKTLLGHPAVSRDLDLDALSLYLEQQYVPAPRSIYRAIRKLPPAHSLELVGARLTLRSYWQPRYRDKLTLGEDEAVEALDRELRRAVASMLVADVPLGAFLSGGVDSSLMTALMAVGSGTAVDTFSLGFTEGGRRSEHQAAETVARHLGCHHHPIQVAARDIRKEIDAFVDVFDEPFGDQAALPTMLLSRATRQHVTVVLTGEGADEVFGGYPSYIRRLRLTRMCRVLGRRGSPIPPLIRLLPASLRARKLAFRMLARPAAEQYTSQSGKFHEEQQRALYSPAFYAARRDTMRAYGARYWAECDGTEPLDRILHVDTRLWLPDNLLTKVDRASMASALEARVPYLDHRLVEFAARLRPEMKIRQGQTKYLLKRVAERYLPSDVVHRPKRGFVMPLGEWLNTEWNDVVRGSLSDDGLLRRGLLQPSSVTRLIAEHQHGRANHEFRLWTLIALELWLARHAPDFRLA